MKLIQQLVILGLILSNPVQAEIYRWVDDNGAVVYSDMPQKNAETVKLPGLDLYKGSSSTATESRSSTSKPAKVDKKKYSGLKITSPINEATIRDNAGKITISMQLTPKLKTGHEIIINLDGKDTKVPGLNHGFTGLDRGAHTISAKVIDASGQALITSEQITFQLIRQSLLSPANKAKAVAKAKAKAQQQAVSPGI